MVIVAVGDHWEVWGPDGPLFVGTFWECRYFAGVKDAA